MPKKGAKKTTKKVTRFGTKQKATESPGYFGKSTENYGYLGTFLIYIQLFLSTIMEIIMSVFMISKINNT